MITLSNLKLKNFLSHVDTNLSLDDYKGLVLIEGQNHDGHYSSNGSGKSTLLEGIVYALTGDTLRGVSVNDVVNRNYNKNTSVSLKFMKDGTPYEVSRYRKDEALGDAIILRKGEENISKRVNKETQKLIEDTLDISYKVLVSTVLLGEGLSSRFTQLSDPEKKSLIESTLNLNYDINKIRESANAKLKSLKLDSAKLEGEISILSNLLDTDIESLEDSIKDQEKCIEIYQSTASEISIKSETLTKEIDAITPKINLLRETLSRYTTLENNRNNLSTNLTQQKEELQRILNAVCPTCSVCRQALQSTDSKNASISHFQSIIDDISKDINIIDDELSRLPEKSIIQDKVDQLSAEYAEKTNYYREIVKDYNDYLLKVSEAQKDIQISRSKIDSAQDANKKLEETTTTKSIIDKEIGKYEYFYKLFSPTGIIVNILEEAIEYINSRLSTYSEVLLEKDYRIEFLKGKISLVDSKGSNYQSLSNGEKRRLDISIQFALHDYCMKYCGLGIDTMFIDEILDTLDDIGIENIITVLRLKLDYCNLSRIFVISHNSELKSYFDRVITVKKDENGDSKILEN